MNKFGLVVISILLLFPLLAKASVSDHPGCSGNCMECHKIDKKDAEAVIKKLKEAGSVPPDVEVLDVKLAPAGGLWQIDLQGGGNKGMLYMDFSKKFLIPQIIPVDAIKKSEPQKNIDFSKLPLKDAVVLGPKNAKKKVAVFTDPDCPYCRRLHEEMKIVLTKRSDVAFYLFLFPLDMHKDSYKKVQAVLCEKSQTLLDDAFTGKSVAEPKCSNEHVEQNKALAKQLEINGTPTVIREDGVVLGGFRAADPLSAWIDGK